MYSATTTAQQVARAQKATQRKDPKFKVQLREVDECLDFVEKLAGIWDAQSATPTRELTIDEQRYIKSEMILCRWDFSYWCVRYHQILSWDGQRYVRMVPHVAQQIILDIFAECEEKQVAIALQVLKARQLGITTLMEAIVEHRVMFHPNTRAIVGSAQPDKSAKMVGKCEDSWERMPWWMMPTKTQSKIGELAVFGALGSQLSIRHGAQKQTDVGRGETPNVAHLCLAPNTLIRVADCTIKPLSELTVEDFVITANGQMAPIKAVVKSPRTNELTSEVWTWGNFAPVHCTRDHKILTDKGYVAASELQEGDFIHYPVRPIMHSLDKFYSRYHRAGGDHKTVRQISIPLTKDWGFLFGLYLAEGSIIHSQKSRDPQRRAVTIALAFHQDEVAEFQPRLDTALEDITRTTTIKRKTSKTAIVSVNCAGLARFTETHFGRTDTKRIPDWAWSAGEEFCLGLVEGYLKGDGHFPENTNEIYASSIRSALSIGLRELLLSLGVGWSSIVWKDGGLCYGRNCRPLWTVTVCGSSAVKLREMLSLPIPKPQHEGGHWRWEENHSAVYIEVREVLDGFSSSFYDVEVADDQHNFLTVGGIVKNSECCEWSHPEDDIDAGLLFAMHPNPSMVLVLESSAGVITDWWNKTWTLNKQRWGDPYNPAKLRPIFLPWYVGRDIYPTEAELRQNPIPADWTPSTLTLQQADRAKEYVASTPLLRANLGAKWTMPREQQWFYEYTRSYYKANDALNVFLREMASNDVECFNSKYSSVFDAEVISNYMNGAKPPVRIYALDGMEQDIRPELKPDYRQRDPNLPTITFDKIFTMVPMKMTGYPNQINPEGLIFVYELPTKDNLYGLGIDTSKGMGQDSSCVEAIRKATIDRVPAQVCEFAHSQIAAHDLPPWTHCIARYYTVEVAGDSTQPKLAIDTSNGGDATQLAMVKLGWSNFHNWIRYDKKRINEGKANFMGFVMVEWARDMVVGIMVKSLRDMLINIDSPWFIEEMSTMEKNEEKVRIEAARGNHDDRFFAMGMIITSMHALDMGGLKSSFGKSAAALQIEEVVPQFPRQPTGQSWAEKANKPPDDTMTKTEFDWNEVVKQAVEDDQRTAPFFEESYGQR